MIRGKNGERVSARVMLVVCLADLIGAAMRSWGMTLRLAVLLAVLGAAAYLTAAELLRA